MATRTITLTDIPDAVYERLEARARQRDVTLADLLREELLALAPNEPELSFREWLDRIIATKRVRLPPGAVVEALHEGRAERY